MIKIYLLAGFGGLYALCTGFFLALPALPMLIGLIGILTALIYCGAVCLFGKLAMWISMAVAVASTIIYVGMTESNYFSVVNFAVASGLCINFTFFGFLAISLPKNLTHWQIWSISAGLFSGSLALGWFIGLKSMS